MLGRDSGRDSGRGFIGFAAKDERTTVDVIPLGAVIFYFMQTYICRVVSQGDVSYVASQKAEGGQLAKCLIRLKEFGGSKFGNEYACTMFGNLAQCKFYEGDLVAASLRFQVHEVNGAIYQEVIANDVVELCKV